jgi:galactosyl transferase GMA12/MNN10 family
MGTRGRPCSAVLALCIMLCVCAVSATSNDALDTDRLPPAVSKSRIALLHMVNHVWFFQELAGVTRRNKRRYAARHGYEMVVHDKSETSGLYTKADCDAPGAVRRSSGDDETCYTPGAPFELDHRAPTFGKIKLALASCVGRPDYWLLWTDADALVFNQARSLLDIVDDAYDIMVASDWFMINAGVLLLRCSEWNIKFLQRLYDAREFDKARALDQSALASFIEEPEVKPHVKHVPKWLFNGTLL